MTLDDQNNFTVREPTAEEAAVVDRAIAALRASLIASGFGQQPKRQSTVSAEEVERFFREPKAITEALRAKAAFTNQNRTT